MSLAYRLYLRIPLREIIDRCPKCNLSQLKSSTHRSYSSNVRVRFAPSPTGKLTHVRSGLPTMWSKITLCKAFSITFE